MLLISQCQDDLYIFLYFVTTEIYGMEMHVSFNINMNYVHLCLQSPVISLKLVHLFIFYFFIFYFHVMYVLQLTSKVSSPLSHFSPILTPIYDYCYGCCLNYLKFDSLTLLLNTVYAETFHTHHLKNNKHTNVKFIFWHTTHQNSWQVLIYLDIFRELLIKIWTWYLPDIPL